MEENLKKAFQKLIFEPQTGLVESIWQKISFHQKRVFRVKLYFFSLIGFLSLAGLVPALKVLLGQFAQSGFYEYLSVAFSGGSNIFSYWRELGYSLLESLPVMNIIFSFGLIFIFMISVRYVLKQIINNKHIGVSYA